MSTDPNLQSIIAPAQATIDAANAVQQELDNDQTTIASLESEVAADQQQHSSDQATIAADEATIRQDEATIAADGQQHTADEDTIANDEAQIQQLQSEVTADEAKIAQLESQTPAAAVVISGIQTVLPEKAADGSVGLWYEARSAGAPKTGPHGTVTITLGEPSVADFHPVNLGGSSDNVYLLRRLYPTLTDAQKAILEKATEFSIGCKVALAQRGDAQAFELDYQIRTKDGIVRNIGGQLLPDGTLRAFDFVKKDWVPLGPKIDLSSMDTFEYPVEIKIDATCDGETVRFTQVTVNGAAFPVTFSHPVTKSTVLNSPYLNAAYQLDAKASAPAYKAIVGELTITFA